jgi:hypothetical protein
MSLPTPPARISTVPARAPAIPRELSATSLPRGIGPRPGLQARRRSRSGPERRTLRRSTSASTSSAGWSTTPGPGHRSLAARSHCRQRHGRDPEDELAVGRDAVALGLRPARHRERARPVRPRPRRPEREVPEGGRAPRRRPHRRAGVHRVPPRALAPGVVEQPPGTTQPRDPAPQRRRGHLPRPRRPDPAGRRRARGAGPNCGRMRARSWPRPYRSGWRVRRRRSPAWLRSG